MRALVAVLASLSFAATAEADVVYRNAVGLRPGEFARFIVEPTVPVTHTVMVTDKRSGERIQREANPLTKPRAYARFNGLRVRIRFQSRLVVRVANESNRGRRVRVTVAR